MPDSNVLRTKVLRMYDGLVDESDGTKFGKSFTSDIARFGRLFFGNGNPWAIRAVTGAPGCGEVPELEGQ